MTQLINLQAIALVISLFLSQFVNAQMLTGIITDGTTNEPLYNATVVVKGTTDGALTDFDGKFKLATTTEPPFTITVSYLGYVSFEQEITSFTTPVKVNIKPNKTILKEVEVVENRITEKQKESPLTVEVLDAIAIKETAAADFYEGLGQLKGVDVMAASIGFRVINTRGFNSTSPVRSLQIIDGVDNQSPGLNFALGNFAGASELDVQKVEIIVGASSAYYGPNAFNGVVKMTTKSPFMKPGVAVSLKGGERNLIDAKVRYAEVFKNKKGVEKLGFKLNVAYMQANDWQADNMDATEQSDNTPETPGGYDAVNRYGDENLTSSINNATSKGQQYSAPGLNRWYRTGYEEKDLVDYKANNLKLATAFHYRLKPKTELIYASSFGTGSTVYQGDNRYQLKDVMFFQNRVEVAKKDKFFIRAYSTQEDAGKTYDAVLTALMLQDSVKSTSEWSQDYRNFWQGQGDPSVPNWVQGGMAGNVQNLSGFPTIGPPPNFYYDTEKANAVINENSDSLTLWHSYTRDYADRNRLVPGTPEFEDALNKITSRSSFDERGSMLIDKSALYHLHGEYIFTPKVANITVGGNGRLYTPNSEGTVFSDTGSVKITNYEFGFYTGLEKKVINDKLKVNVSSRIDKNQNYDYVISPAVSFVYSLNKDNIVRLSFSSAVRNPTLADQYLYYNVGRAMLVGNVDGFDSVVTIESIEDYFAVEVPQRSSLVYFDVPPVRPEKVKSIEIGYRTTLFNNVFFDGSYYYSQYKDFLGYKIGGDVHFDPLIPNNISSIDFYRIAANSEETVITNGASGGLTFYLKKYYSITGNYSWNKLKKVSAEDDIIPAYNTPEHKFNIGFGGRDITAHFNLFNKVRYIKHFGFNINYKWVQGFLYEGSPQFTGHVPTYDMLDAQINKTVPKIHTTFKLGASNLLNNEKFQVYGGPRIGRMIYFSILLELDKKEKEDKKNKS